MKNIKGTGVALITPFCKDLTIDWKALRNLINYVIDGGVNFLVLLGTTGESAVLSKSEKIKIIDFCIKINNNRLPIIVGLGGNNTKQIVSDIKSLNLNKVDAILSVSPYYNKPTQEGIYNHYKIISDASNIPIIIYNVPGRTSSNISAQTTLKLANDFQNIIAIKEASGDLNQIMMILKNKPKDFAVFSGDDNLTLPMIYLGAEGVISVIGQSHPKVYSEMVNHAITGKINLANKLHYSLLDFYSPLFEEGNPVGIKACLERLGISKSYVRPPLMKASKKIINKFKKII